MLERLPDLRVCFAHGGGSFPATVGRIEHGFNMRPDLVATNNDKGPRQYLDRLYFDSVVHDPMALRYLIDLVGTQQIMLGTDYPVSAGRTTARGGHCRAGSARRSAATPVSRVGTALVGYGSRRTGMNMQITLANRRFQVRTDHGVDISQRQSFDESQPRFFGAPAANSEALQSDEFCGDTAAGGSCNVSRITTVVHCNGTHCESARHVSHNAPTIAETLSAALVPALVLTPTQKRADRQTDNLSVTPRPTDLVWTRTALEDAVADVKLEAGLIASLQAVILRSGSVSGQDYDQQSYPFLTLDAARWLRQHQIAHVLTDTPSLDRADDEGQLSAHRIFFGLPLTGTQVPEYLPPRTITEMLHIPEKILDGLYLLNHNVAPWQQDAAPARPVLFPLEYLHA